MIAVKQVHSPRIPLKLTSDMTVISGTPDPSRFHFPPLTQRVPIRSLLERWETEKVKLPQSQEGKLLQHIQVQCPKGKKYLEETLRITYLLLQNQRYWMEWMESEENRTLIHIMLEQWLTRTNKKSGQELWCYMKHLPNHCDVHRHLGNLFRNTVVKVIELLKPYSKDIQKLLQTVPGIVAEIESYCGLETSERWTDLIIETFRWLSTIFRKTSDDADVESFAIEKSNNECPPCMKDCSTCQCNAWSTKEKAGIAMVGFCLGVFVVYTIKKAQ